MSVHLRDLFGKCVPTDHRYLETSKGTPIVVEVPIFGRLLVGRHPDTEDQVFAMLVPHGATRGMARTVKETDSTYEVEILPNISGEDRLVVVVDKDDIR